MKKVLLLISILTLSFTGIKADPVNPPVPLNLFIKMIHILHQQQESTNVLLHSTADKTLKLRLKKDYEIFDAKGKLILKGSGKEIDIKDLPDGKYTIKFDKDYNQIEYFKKV
jgi:hypothetical protein